MKNQARVTTLLNASAIPTKMMAVAAGAAATILLFSAQAQAQTNTLVDPVLVSYSTQDPFGVNLPAIAVVQSGGLSGPGLPTDTMSNSAAGDMWQTIGTTAVPYDYAPYITFDLGEAVNLSQTLIWNLNYAGGTQYGPKDIAIVTSLDDTNWTVLNADLALNQAGGSSNEPCQVFSTPNNSARYIQLQILDTWDGASFNWPAYGVSAADGNDPRDFTGLSKVRFIVNGLAGVPVTQQPQSQELVIPSLPLATSVSFSVGTGTPGVPLNTNGTADTNVGPISFQWYFDSGKLTDNGTNITGSASNSLNIANATAANAGTY